VWGDVAQYGAVAAFGVGTGLAELVSRYKDDPTGALATKAAWLYMAINGLASIGALGLIHTFGWTFGVASGDVIAIQLLVAGFGAMTLFRSSLFTVRIGKSDVGVGPSTLLSLVLAACDRGVDRRRAENRAQLAAELMRDVGWDKAKDDLPAVAVALMQNLDPPDLAAMQLEIATLKESNQLSAHAKALGLAAALFTAVGPDVLREAKKALGKQLTAKDGEQTEDTEEESPAHIDQPPVPGGGEGGDGPGDQAGELRGIQERNPPRGRPATPQTPNDPYEGP
jgi:hypothetical protein